MTSNIKSDEYVSFTNVLSKFRHGCLRPTLNCRRLEWRGGGEVVLTGNADITLNSNIWTREPISRRGAGKLKLKGYDNPLRVFSLAFKWVKRISTKSFRRMIETRTRIC